jgi:hypothetical protein
MSSGRGCETVAAFITIVTGLIVIVVFVTGNEYLPDFLRNRDNSGSTAAPSFPAPSFTPVPSFTPTLTNSGVPSTECVITIAQPLVSLKSEPDVFSQDLVRVPLGEYSMLEHRIVQTPLGEESWLQIQVGGRVGWVENNSWTINSKTDLCP